MYRQIHTHLCIRHGVQTSNIYIYIYIMSMEFILNQIKFDIHINDDKLLKTIFLKIKN